METELFLADGRTDRQTYRHDEANSRFSQFCGRAQKVYMVVLHTAYFIISRSWLLYAQTAVTIRILAFHPHSLSKCSDI
jgi:hypothetical protein